MKDFFGRELNYVRISVTDRCNYRCRYCMPEDGVEWLPHDTILTYEEIFFLIEILRGFGVKKVRFTGGEPLVRKGMVQFLEKVTDSFPDLRVALTTNGSTLKQHAQPLARLGLTSINISLDTLSPEKFSAMTRGASIEPVLDGIDALESLAPRDKTEIKINSVLMRGFNSDSGMIGQLVNFAFEKGIILRFIEFMPLHSDLWSRDVFVPFSEVLAMLPGFAASAAAAGGGCTEDTAGPASYYINAATGQRIGVISAVSRHFCESCNRLRVTSTGFVRPCLFNSRQISIAGALRNRDEEKVRALLGEAAAIKPVTGAAAIEASAYADGNERRSETNMNAIGG